MGTQTSAKIQKPDGTDIKVQDSMVYLGSLLTADGRIASELGRRLGMAKSDFTVLERVWKHSSLSRKKQIRIFDACVCSKLCYGLFTATLNKADKRRIDGFHARCLRKILRIPHAYYSRISNKTVLEITKESCLSAKIQKQQEKYLIKLTERDDNDPARSFVFEPGSLNWRAKTCKRKQGRPRTEWVTGLKAAVNG